MKTLSSAAGLAVLLLALTLGAIQLGPSESAWSHAYGVVSVGGVLVALWQLAKVRAAAAAAEEAARRQDVTVAHVEVSAAFRLAVARIERATASDTSGAWTVAELDRLGEDIAKASRLLHDEQVKVHGGLSSALSKAGLLLQNSVKAITEQGRSPKDGTTILLTYLRTEGDEALVKVDQIINDPGRQAKNG